MGKQFHLTCVVDLPDNEFEAARLIHQISEPWQGLIAKLQADKVAFDYHVATEAMLPRPRGRPPKGDEPATKQAAYTRKRIAVTDANRKVEVNGHE